MATKLGYFEIHNVCDNRVEGYFKSVHDKNVFKPTKAFACVVLFEVWEKFEHLKSIPKLYSSLLTNSAVTYSTKDLENYIMDVSFETALKPSTKFTFTVIDKTMLDFLPKGNCKISWDSYFWG